MRAERIRALLRRPFARNLGWLGAGEAAVRVTRLLAAVVLARQLGLEGFGIAAVALTVHELFFVIARAGLGAKLVQCAEHELEAVARTVQRLNWLLATILTAAQAATGVIAAAVYQEPALVPLIASLALVHLISPWGMVQTALLRREGRLRSIAIAQVLTVGTDNILTALLALAGFGPWAFVAPKILATPIWVAVVRRHRPWRAAAIESADWRPIVRFARRVLGSDALAALRDHMDYLLVGRILGIEALGLYYFAFNAGLGFSMVIIRSFADSLYPYLCAARGDIRDRFFEASRMLAVSAVPLILLQCALAPVYVPLVFGARWSQAVPVLVLVCLSALPRLCGVGSSQLLRALGRPDVELRWSFAFTLLLAGALGLGLTAGVTGVAVAVLAAHTAFLPLCALMAVRLAPSTTTAAVCVP